MTSGMTYSITTILHQDCNFCSAMFSSLFFSNYKTKVPWSLKLADQMIEKYGLAHHCYNVSYCTRLIGDRVVKSVLLNARVHYSLGMETWFLWAMYFFRRNIRQTPAWFPWGILSKQHFKLVFFGSVAKSHTEHCPCDIKTD